MIANKIVPVQPVNDMNSYCHLLTRGQHETATVGMMTTLNQADKVKKQTRCYTVIKRYALVLKAAYGP